MLVPVLFCVFFVSGEANAQYYRDGYRKKYPNEVNYNNDNDKYRKQSKYAPKDLEPSYKKGNNNISQYAGIKISGVYMDAKSKVNVDKLSGININDHSKVSFSSNTFGAGALYGMEYKTDAGRFRIEFDGSYGGKVDNSYFKLGRYEKYDIMAGSLMFNLYYELPLEHFIRPYFGGGIGVSFIDIDYNIREANDSKMSENNVNFAWNLAVGITMDITNNTRIDFGYRYVNYGSVSEAKNSRDNLYSLDIDTSAHEAVVGFRYHF